MPTNPTPAELRLVEIYKQAYLDIIQRIERKTQGGSLAWHDRSILVDVHRILDDLGVDMRKWATEELPALHLQSAENVYDAFIAAGSDMPPFSTAFASIHQTSVMAIVQNMTNHMEIAHEVVGRRVEDMIRDAQLDIIGQKQAQGLTIDQAQKMLVQRLGDEGLTCFTDSAGRKLRLDKYANMVARTVTREATNLGLLDELQDAGKDLVQISPHYGPCEICAPYVGRVYSISGRTDDYPALRSIPGFRSGYQTMHPNCKHVLLPYIVEFDDHIDQTKRDSNRPFVDRRSRNEIAAYEDGQKKKAQANADWHQYESYKAWLPHDVPKSFAGWRRMKAAQSERYLELQSLYREVRRIG